MVITNRQDSLLFLLQFNQKFQDEIQEHQIEKNRAKEGYEEYLRQGKALNELLQKIQNNTLENPEECNIIDEALNTWKEEVDKYVPFQFLRKKQYKYIDKVKKAKENVCFERQK